MSEGRSVTPYASPQIRDYGRLSVLTAFDGGGLHFAQVALGSLPGGGTTPTTPTTPAQNVLENTQSGGGTPTAVPDSSVVNDTGSSGPGSGSSPGGSATEGVEAGSNGAGGGSGSLPFTGMAVGPIAALGAGLAAAGAALRSRIRRP